MDSSLRLRTLDEDYLKAHREDLRRAVNDIFSENFAFVPIEADVFDLAFGPAFLKTICPKTSFVVEHESGAIAALCICYFRKDTLYVKTVGVVSAFRGQGISLLSILLAVLARAGSCESVVLCLMREGNFPSVLLRSLIETETRYALFSKELR
jgi:hypothetical protein